jgi:DMSO/TMAO reductase YedYZ molybdopterin-dependent catalytic subunit
MKRRLPAGAAIGLVTAGVAIAVAQLVSAFIGDPVSSPVIAVGQAAIDLAPGGVKEFAITTFGTHDKLALLTGIAVLLAIFAVAMGVLALGRRWIAYAGLAVFGAVGLAAVLTRANAGQLAILPTIVGAAAGLAAIKLFFDASAREPVAESPLDFDRRRFLVTGVGLGAAAALAGFGSRLAGASTAQAVASRKALRIPKPAEPAPALPAGGDLHVPGLSTFYTPTSSFYRVDTALIVPKIHAENWRLRIHGLVDKPIELDIDQLLARPLIERDITIACVSNEVGGSYIGNARWIGARLKPILQEAGVSPRADQLVSRSADGFTVGTPVAAVMDGRDAMLAVAMNGEPLPLAHGFPVRMIVPGLYGYVSACKWIVDMELTTFGAFDAYWVPRGWAQKAPIKTMSRIDTPRVAAGHGRVAVAGVAWAQHKGIARVEVQVDDGPWQPAKLAAQDTIDTWRQWVYMWDATPGSHVLRVRATDKTGYTQTSDEAPPAPDGASGWHTVTISVV